MNQSEIEKNTYNRRQAREHSGEQVTTPSRFASDWLIKLSSARQFLLRRRDEDELVAQASCKSS